MQRYLCVDGVEVSNPNRTIAYLKAKAGHMLRGGPGQFARGSCDCPTFWSGPSLCEVVVTGGYDVSDPDQLCQGIQMPGDYSNYMVAIRVLSVSPTPLLPRPAAPTTDDAGWVTTFVGPVDGPMWSCLAYEDWPTPSGALYIAYSLLNTTTGVHFEVMSYLSGYSPAFGDTGGNEISFDGGTTWSSAVRSHTYSDLPCAVSLPEYLTSQFVGVASDEGVCLGTLWASGFTAPTTFEASYFPVPAPIDEGDLPDPDDPGWVTVGSGTLAAVIGQFGCNEWDALPPDGFWRVSYTDLAGNSIVSVAALNYSLMGPGDLAGSSLSLDGGDTWTPLLHGYTTLTFGEPPIGHEFSTPDLDDAPWYDPSVPESADVLGVWLNTFDLSSPHKRDKRDRAWGSSLGSVKYVGRELVISGVVFATNARATAYARQWLYEALSGGCAGGPCGLPDALVYTACPEAIGGTDQLRTLKRIGLVSYDPLEPDDEFPACWGFRFEATLATETPFMYHEPVTSYRGPIVPIGQESVCNICVPCPPPPSFNPLVCGCADVPARVVPEPDPDDCWCNPVTINRVTAVMAAPHFWTEATAIIKITAGFDVPDPKGPGLRNLRIRAWPNPVDLPPPPLGTAEGLNCVDPCMEIDVACIPQGATLTIDGTTHRATLSNGGGEVNGYPYLSSDSGMGKFVWPEVGCYGLVIAIDSDAFPGNTAPDSTIEIQMVGTDRG